MWQLKVRTSKKLTSFVRSLAQGLWGSKRLRKRNISGISRTADPKKKATPRKKECVMGKVPIYMLLSIILTNVTFIVYKTKFILNFFLHSCSKGVLEV